MREDRFFIFMCPKCGNLQIKEVRSLDKAIFKCFRCNKTRKIKSSIRPGLQLRSFGRFNCNKASEEIQKLKLKGK